MTDRESILEWLKLNHKALLDYCDPVQVIIEEIEAQTDRLEPTEC